MPTLGSMVYRSMNVCLHASLKSVARSHPKSTWLPGSLLQLAREVGGGGQMAGDTPPKACSCQTGAFNQTTNACRNGLAKPVPIAGGSITPGQQGSTDFCGNDNRIGDQFSTTFCLIGRCAC